MNRMRQDPLGFRLALRPGRDVRPLPTMTLRPADGLEVVVSRRTPIEAASGPFEGAAVDGDAFRRRRAGDRMSDCHRRRVNREKEAMVWQMRTLVSIVCRPMGRATRSGSGG